MYSHIHTHMHTQVVQALAHARTAQSETPSASEQRKMPGRRSISSPMGALSRQENNLADKSGGKSSAEFSRKEYKDMVVLVVDDHEANLLMLKSMLSK